MPTGTPQKVLIISWPKVILTVLIIVVVAGAISGSLFWYFCVRQSEESTPTTTTKQATSSAKKATPPAQKDETTGWKTLVTQTAESNPDIYDPTKTIKFSFKYPPDFKETTMDGRSVVTNDPNFQLGLKTVGSIGALATFDDKKPTSSTDFILGGKKASRGTVTWEGRGTEPTSVTITYYLSSVTTKEGSEFGFSFRCNYLPKAGIDAEKTCDLMASTFKFL